MSRKSIAGGLVALALVSGSLPAAAAGYFQGTKGARAAGRAGAFTARADDLMAVAFNPAGLSDVNGTLIQVGNRFSYNAYSFTRKPTLDWGSDASVPPYVEFAEVENDVPWQLLDPLVGAASNFGLKDWGFALAAYAPPGVSRLKFPQSGGQRYMMVEREAIIINYTASAAWQFRDLFGVGLSLQAVAVPKLRYDIVIDGNTFPRDANPVASEFDMLASTEGSDLFTPNAIIGAWYRPVPFLELGFAAQVIPASIETESELQITPLTAGMEDVVIERDGEPANDVTLNLPLPVTARLGVRYIHLVEGQEIFDLELDLGYESWSRVERFTVGSNGLAAILRGQRVDVGTIQIEKQWQDTFSVQLGGDYQLLPGWGAVRGGLFYESAVADEAYANVDFVGGPVLGGALGASVLFAGFEIALAYELRVQATQSVNERDSRVYQEIPASECPAPYTDPGLCHPEFLGRPGPPVNAGEFRAHSHIASLDVMYRF